MKNTKYYILITLLLLSIFSCKKEDNKAKSTLPEIVSIWPESATPNTIITITGYNFSPNRTDNEVQIKGKDAVVIEASASELQVVSPVDSGSGAITLTINGYTVTGPDFTYVQPTDDEQSTADSIYVKVNGSGEGSSWEDASGLDAALKKATNGNIIFLAAGTYTPSSAIKGGNAADPGDLTFEIDNNITLIGGYPSDVSDINTPADPSVNKTILSGQIGSGGESYHVMVIAAPVVIGQKVKLSGLVIRGGNASTATSSVSINGIGFVRNYGGGMMIGGSTVEIENCEITENKSQGFIAGMFIFGGADVTLTDSKVTNNICEVNSRNGAGIWVQSSKAHLYNCEVSGNECKGVAPGIYGYPNATVYLYNSKVQDNSGTSYGAGTYIRDGSKAVIVNSLITGNQSTSGNGGGGLMMYDNCDALVVSSTISGNNIQGPGGGIYRQNGTNTLSVYNSIISGNQQNSSDVDDDGSQPSVIVVSSVIGTKAYNSSGNEASETFDPNSMLSTSFLPTGSNNPALLYGLSGNDLSALNSSVLADAEKSYLIVDMNENSRSGKTIMGALVE